MTYARRAFAGAAVQTTLDGAINSTSLTITLDNSLGWPSGAEFYAVIDPGQATEEKILCTRSFLTLTCASTAKRGVDGTAAASHSNGAVIYPCVAAADLDEANDLVAEYTTRGDVVTVDSNGDFARVALGTNGLVLQSDGSDLVSGQVITAGITDLAVTAAKLADDVYTKPVQVYTALASQFSNTNPSAQGIVLMNVATANDFQIVPDATENLPVGTVFRIAQIGAGQTTIAASIGVTLNGTPGLKLRAQYSVAFVIKTAANTWLAWGDLAA
jgi:hypothetical protein